MSWVATERFEARIAPGGLALVQELVNTHAVERDGDDLLPDLASAQKWLEVAARQWARTRGLAPPAPVLAETDLQKLRDLREVVTGMLAGEPVGVELRAMAHLVSDGEGRVGLEPVGTDGNWLESAVWSEILLAQQTGTWTRLKLCREPGCRSAFFDTSRNHSGVWHNVYRCGNITNLRASRTRRKLSDSGSAAD